MTALMDVKMEDAAAAAAVSTVESNNVTPLGVEKKEKSPYDTLKASKTSVEEIVAKMLVIKKEEKPKSELCELVTQMFLNFVSLRQANRMILIEEDRVKAETERAKAPVDSTTLQLHNLMYEKSHYLKAIKACKDFKSKYPDIELVSEGEFLSKAPEEFKETAMSNDTAHNLMLKRLNYELFQRKEFCKFREKLELQKKNLLETIANRKKFLSSLPSHLKALKKASLPAQNQLGVLHSKKLKQLHAAELLPPPLYIVYSQFMAQKEAFDENIELETIGSLKDAHAFARQQTSKENGISSHHESSRIDDDVPDDEDDGQRRRKRPKKVAGRENAELTGVYQAHPLRILIHVHDDEVSDPRPARLISLKFEYLFKLNVVCVGVEVSNEAVENNVLCNLFPDDDGLELPHQSAKLLLGDGAVFDEKRTMRPYKWAQHLAGIDFLPEVSPSLTRNEIDDTESAKDTVVSGLSIYRQQSRVETVIRRVRARKKAQLALAEQLDLLASLKWPPLNCESVPWALLKHRCSLHRWSLVRSSANYSSSLARADMKKGNDSSDVSVPGKAALCKDDVGVVPEDGELPSLIPVAAVAADYKSTVLKPESDLDHSKLIALISKSIIPPAKTARSHSFGRHDDDSDLCLDGESEADDISKSEGEVEVIATERRSWVDYGSQDFNLSLIRTDSGETSIELEAKIKISMEYPVRPPLFSLRVLSQSSGGNCASFSESDWYNELHAMENEVNSHLLKMLPLDQENYALSHQVHCLAMLFDLYLNDASQPSDSSKCTSVIDVGLCKPVSGGLLARSYRGRDRRKILSWKDMECTPGYPF